MAVIVPFRGLRYNDKVAGDPADAIAPPYDMITAAEQEQLYHNSPYNLIRLEYGKAFPEDGAGNNRYTRAAADLKRWLEEKALILEGRRSFYLYRQSFALRGRTFRRTGIITALKLEPYSSRIILPHEDTLAAPKKDRLELLRSCRANFSPVFGLFSDPQKRFREICTRLRQEKPLYEFTDRKGEEHALWAVQDRPSLTAAAQLMAEQQIFIADGHHRYDTALQYAQEKGAGTAVGSAYVLAVLVTLEDPGLVILPFHRLLAGLPPAQLEQLRALSGRYYHVEDRGRLEDLDMEGFSSEIGTVGKEAPAMGLLLPGGASLLHLKEGNTYDELDVALLKRLILDPVMGGATATPGRQLDYIIDGGEALGTLLNGRAQAAFILNPTPLEAVTARALRGENMPEKSTCFYPKLPGGLVLHHLELSHSR